MQLLSPRTRIPLFPQTKIGLTSGDLVHVLRIGDEPTPEPKRLRAEDTPAQPAPQEKSVTTEIHYARGMVWESTVTYTGPAEQRGMESGTGTQNVSPVQGISTEHTGRTSMDIDTLVPAEGAVHVLPEVTGTLSVGQALHQDEVAAESGGGEHDGHGQAVSTAVVVESATSAGMHSLTSFVATFP